MRLKELPEVRELIENEWTQMFNESRDNIRQEAKEKIRETQQANLKNYDKNGKKR